MATTPEASIAPAGPGAFDVRRGRRDFALLEGAVIMSGIGNGVAAIAIPWLILERTGQATAAGIVGAATALPLLFSALFSGAVVDTLGTRRTSVISDVLSAVSVMAIPLVDMAFGLNLAAIVVLAVIGSVFDPAGATAREAMLPQVAAESGLGLERVNGIHEASWGLAYLIGPGLGGLLIGVIGASGALWATAVGFVASAALVALVKLGGAGAPTEEDKPETIVKGAADGLRFVWNDRLIRDMTILTMALIAVYMPIEGVILPYIFERLGRPTGLGVVLMGLAAGGVVGSLLYGAIGKRVNGYLAFVVSMFGSALSILGMSFLPPYAWLVAFALLAGVFWGPVNPLLNIAMQTRTPPAKRGRVLGVVMATSYAAGPAGYIIAGPAVERFGAEATFIVVGVGLVLVAVAALFFPSLRELGKPGPYSAELTMAECRPPASEPTL